MNPLIFVTGNTQKMEEAKAILNIPLKIMEMNLDETQSLDLEVIARKKAHDAYAQIQKPLFVDDAGFYLDAWNGFPGPFIKYLREAGGNDLLLKMLQGERNRRVTAVCVIAYHDGETVHVFQGEVKGTITDTLRGKSPGWDPTFVPDGHTKSWAEMSLEEKNTHSHRKNALEKFKKYLRNQAKKGV